MTEPRKLYRPGGVVPALLTRGAVAFPDHAPTAEDAARLVASTSADARLPLFHPAYMAGIIDGEGTIITRRRNIRLSVSNTNEELMLRLGHFGGVVSSRNPRRGLGKLPAWDWNISGEAACIILRACLPHMVVKRLKAIECMAEFESITGSNHQHFCDKARAEFPHWPAAEHR